MEIVCINLSRSVGLERTDRTNFTESSFIVYKENVKSSFLLKKVSIKTVSRFGAIKYRVINKGL